MAQVRTHGIIKEYPEGTTWMEVIRKHQKEYKYGTLLVRISGRLQELYRQIKDCELSFVTAEDKLGMSVYQRSASPTMLKTSYSVTGPGNMEKLMIGSSIGRGFFVEARGNLAPDQEFLDAVKVKMREHVERETSIMRHSVSTDNAIELFEKLGMYDKARLFRYRMVPKVDIYSINGLGDYYYGYMVQSTGYTKHFDLVSYHYGFVTVMPDRNTPDILHKFAPSDKLFATLSESTGRGGRMDLGIVDALSDRVAEGDMSRLILIQEALQEKKIAEITAQIVARKNAHFVTIVGPSSSDETTFSHRLSVQLETIGPEPHPIAVGNYFVGHVDSPRDEHGNYNYKILECLDVELFNRDMTGLLEGKRVELPYYNFKKGVGEYKGNFLQLGKGDMLVIEGVRCLNDRLSCTLLAGSRLRIYISALTQFNIDEHDRIPITDGRLLRRMVRDVRTRGFLTRETIRAWSSVRKGEEEDIFPLQEEADIMFNSALVYELAMLKQYAQPLFFVIPRDNEE